MTSTLLVLTPLLAGLLAMPAAAEELPRSPACRTALQALDQAEEAIAAAAAASAALPERERQRSVAARLQPLRLRVADACLGGLTTSPPPSQRSWAMPAPARPSAALPRPPAAPQPLPPVTIPRPQPPVTVSHCNGPTCIASDGSTLTRVGPNVVGPRGLCTVQGIFLQCP